MDRAQIMQLLPHRPPMLLLDEALRLEDGSALGRYRVRGDEFFLQGHFPGRPTVPGVILCEILAQSACALLAGALGPGELPMFTGLDRVRFRAPVSPGDCVETRCAITRARAPFYFARGEVRVEGRLCMTAEFSFAVTGV